MLEPRARGVLRRAGDGARRRPHRRRRPCARPGRPCRPRPGTGTTTPCATRSTRTCARIRWRCSRPSGWPRASTRASRRSSAHYLYRIVNRRRRPRRSSAAAPGGSPSRSTRAPCTRPRSAWSASTTSPPSAHTECQAKSPVKTLDRLDVDARPGDEIAGHRLGALVPAHPGALDGRARWSPSARANGAPTTSPRRLAARDRTACGRWRRRTGSIWRRSTTMTPQGLDRNTDRGSSDRPPSACARSATARALVDLVHGRADQAEFEHRAIVLDEARIRGAAGGRELRRGVRSPP